MQIVRANSTGIAREEVEDQLPEIDRLEVRAALKTLRNAHHLDAVTEGSTVLYRSPEYQPARQQGTSLERPRADRPALNLVKTTAAAPAPAASRVVRLLGEDEAEPTKEADMPKTKKTQPLDGGEAIVKWLKERGAWMRRGEIPKSVAKTAYIAKQLLEQLVEEKAIQARGERAGRRYAALGIAADAQPGAASAPAERRPAPRKPEPAPAVLSSFALTLHVDLPNCKGTMTLDEAREFAAFVGTVAGGS